MTQPFCRYCGKAIRKRTNSVTCWGGKHPSGTILRSKEDCQRLSNEKVVSVSYHEGVVWSFSTWDGESYVDRFFCNDDHAKRFGYAAAKAGVGASLKRR